MELESITSAVNAKVRLAAALKARRQREKTGKFLVEGVRLAEMAADAEWGIDFALVTEKVLGDARAATVIEKLRVRGVPCAVVPGALLSKISATETPQGLLLVLRQQAMALAALPQEKAPCYAVLDGVQDPGNLGTILRTADAAGLSGLILLKGTADVYSPKVVRAAMGSLFHLPVVREVTAEAFLAFARERGLMLYATALDASAAPHFAVDFNGSCAIVFGNEGSGVSQELLTASRRVYIPMFGGAESLNVAVSAAIVLYEAVRQRRSFGEDKRDA